jgi:hypothetical protein
MLHALRVGGSCFIWTSSKEQTELFPKGRERLIHVGHWSVGLGVQQTPVT